MYDRKVVRRRRAALAVFVALSIAILTAYFGESGGGFFHALQRGAPGGVRPDRERREPRAQAGARPVRMGRRHRRRQEGEQGAEARGGAATAPRSPTPRPPSATPNQLKGLVGLTESDGFPRGTEPIAARVIARSPTVWYSSITIDKGESDGVRMNQPVIAAGSDPEEGEVGGLVGKVTDVTGGTAG